MGLIRGVARTAVIAGTATTVSNRVSRRQAGRWAAQEEQATQSQQAQSAPPPQSQAPAEDMDNKLAQLQQLGELKSQGVITETEFQAQKSRILGS